MRGVREGVIVVPKRRGWCKKGKAEGGDRGEGGIKEGRGRGNHLTALSQEEEEEEEGATGGAGEEGTGAGGAEATCQWERDRKKREGGVNVREIFGDAEWVTKSFVSQLVR